MSRNPPPDLDENPEWTDEDFARARPLEAVLTPAILAQFPNTRPARGPQKTPTKIAVSLRLSRDAVERFKQGGPGWQTRVDAALRKAVGLD